MKSARLITAVAVLAVLAGGGVAAATRPAPKPAARFVTDDQGRVLLLHGFNTASSAKSTPDGLPTFTEADLDREYRDMGTNFVRFLIQWRTLEPTPGTYDTKYLDKVAERVAWYAKRGYHVMLDMHQDLWGSDITPGKGAGNGAPGWATHLDGLPVSTDQPTWEMYYLEPGVIRAFDHFWNTTGDHPELMDHYAKAWKAVAARFKDDPAVIGYDLMNEPWGGSIQGAQFETGPLATLYRRSIAEIRSVDPDGWIFLEPQAVGVNWGLPSALPHFDDPRDGQPRIGLAPHLYPLPLDLGDDYTAGSRRWTDCTLGWWRDNILRTAERVGGPVVLGEFGLDMSRPGSPDLVKRVLQLTDEVNMGHAYWSRDPGPWGPYDDKGKPGPLVAAMARPYPRAVGGVPVSVAYDEKSRALTLVFDANSTGPTEIYLPARDFPHGGRASIGEATWDAGRRVLTVKTKTAGRLTLTITPG
ncbi:cellulase family glycosylhydrolase [Nonomuraea roseoviolacea]|uniref:Endoglycosylceramidase n=1 Tax=Nonomuraea roseoviolacea subsp. carminata TaxID=160689 RepID=A0ABT1KCD5_9ACTN|nr:cellulase family glycosylhydrolase [Nonomuraea roseoviolacea]MCP2351677.1 endoglycosylceramidase [Nonomuraea roseoviolacea subsp. carminata]